MIAVTVVVHIVYPPLRPTYLRHPHTTSAPPCCLLPAGGKPPGGADLEGGYPAGDGGYPQYTQGYGGQGYPPPPQAYGQGQQPGGYLASAMPPGAAAGSGDGVVQGIPVWGRVQSYMEGELAAAACRVPWPVG
jgi:hypothetical protein